MQKITVSLGYRSYPITITTKSFDNFNYFWPLKADDHVMIVTNCTLKPLYLEKLSKLLMNSGLKIDQLTLPDGEQYKTIETMNEVFNVLLKKKYGRDATIIALGGGVIGDLTGFVAATYQRGIRFIQIPTSLLSQVDSSIGGKTSVNHQFGKNMIGAFYQPASVVIDIDCLDTLPMRELKSGLAEVIKYGIILDDNFFQWLEKNIDRLLSLDKDAISYCIRCCCELKAKVVSADERENGIRSVLNLGHTFGHAIEVYMGYGNWSHGEAVSAGIVMAARTAERLGQFNKSETERIITLLQRTGLPVYGPNNMKPEDYLPYMMLDKKVLLGKLRLVLPNRIGNSKVYIDVSHDIVLEAINDCKI